jgi:hypothetical protein
MPGQGNLTHHRPSGGHVGVVLARGGTPTAQARYNVIASATFRRWKDHDAYQQAFDRVLRDLKAVPG